MLKKLGNLFSSKERDPSPEEKAKAVFLVLIISLGNSIIKDILNSSPEKFQKSISFKEFLADEIALIMCLHSTREGWGFFEDSKERDLFSGTLSVLFNNFFKIAWNTFNTYLKLLENSDNPDKLLMQQFTGRIVAFLNGEGNIHTSEKILIYSHYPDAMIYLEFYAKIFEMIIRILKDFASKDANSREVIEMSKKLDESFGSNLAHKRDG